MQLLTHTRVSHRLRGSVPVSESPRPPRLDEGLLHGVLRLAIVAEDGQREPKSRRISGRTDSSKACSRAASLTETRTADEITLFLTQLEALSPDMRSDGTNTNHSGDLDVQVKWRQPCQRPDRTIAKRRRQGCLEGQTGQVRC